VTAWLPAYLSVLFVCVGSPVVNQTGLAMANLRTPVDLQATTRDIKNRCARASGSLEQIAQTKEAIFPDPRQVILELVLARHEVEAAIVAMKRAWWPP
jgi:hypothetical protein